MARKEITTLMVKKRTRDKLAKLGEYGDSMDDIINKLLEKSKKSAEKKPESGED